MLLDAAAPSAASLSKLHLRTSLSFAVDAVYCCIRPQAARLTHHRPASTAASEELRAERLQLRPLLCCAGTSPAHHFLAPCPVQTGINFGDFTVHIIHSKQPCTPSDARYSGQRAGKLECAQQARNNKRCTPPAASHQHFLLRARSPACSVVLPSVPAASRYASRIRCGVLPLPKPQVVVDHLRSEPSLKSQV